MRKFSQITESVWNDMRKRSLGDSVKKENELPQGEQQALATYIDMFASIAFTGEYTVGSYPDFRAFIRDVGNAQRLSGLEYDVNDLLQYVKDNWDDVVLPTILDTIDKLNKHINIAVDSIIDSLKNTGMNESVWNDMRKRSLGDDVKKEDERHKILERLLATYIKLFAESCYYHDEYTSGSYPDFRAYIKDFRDNPRIEEVCPDDSYFDDLLNYVNKETWNDQIDDTVMEMTNRLDKGEHLITDDVIEELRKHNVNESVWNDMRKRSLGGDVKKEDDINALDGDAFCEYIKNKYDCDLTQSPSGIFIKHFYNGPNNTESGCFINIPLFKYYGNTASFMYYPTQNEIGFGCTSQKYSKMCLDLLEYEFEPSEGEVTFNRRIQYVQGDVTNKVVIELIDFILDHIHKPATHILTKRG